MEGVVALIEGEAGDRVFTLWDAFERETGIASRFPGAQPHVSFHVARQVDEVQARIGVAKLAAATQPFAARTFGLGVFAGHQPILWIGVTPSRRLLSLQAEVHAAMAGRSSGQVPEYLPGAWVPHITVGQSNIPPDRSGEALAWWTRQQLSWEIVIDNLAIGADSDDGVTVHLRLPLGGASA